MKILYEPVAVRHKKVFFLLFAAKRGQAIENSLEKAKKGSAAVGIFFKHSPCCERRLKRRKIKNILGEMQIMKKTLFTKLLSFAFCIVLIAAMALLAGCNDDANISNPVSSGVAETLTAEKSFTFVVVDTTGKETSFEISSDKATVGEALLDEGLIAGEDGQYGLYVKTVNGITLDYDTDGKYWAFYVNSEYGMTGVDATEIVAGATYSFKAE